jgi:hypothetical protein
MQTETSAKQTLADFKDKLAQLEIQKVNLENERDILAFDATVGEPKAKQKLEKIIEQLMAHYQRMSVVHGAIRTAELRLLEAQGHTKQQIEQANAEKALKLARELWEAAKAAHHSFDAAFVALADLRATVTELNKLGCNTVNLNLVDANLRRSLITASMAGGPSLALGHTPPAERHSVFELGANWSRAVEGWANQRLESKQKSAA